MDRAAEIAAALAPRLAAAEAVVDGLPDQAAALVAAVERDGVAGAKAFLVTLGEDLGARMSAALGVDVTGRFRDRFDAAAEALGHG